ncbi:MAG: terminase small subunit, partial [Stellaceae bacterium]
AALRAGYGAAGARLAGWRLLQRPLVRAAFAKAQTESAVRTGISTERVLQEFARIGLADLGRLLAWARTACA